MLWLSAKTSRPHNHQTESIAAKSVVMKAKTVVRILVKLSYFKHLVCLNYGRRRKVSVCLKLSVTNNNTAKNKLVVFPCKWFKKLKMTADISACFWLIICNSWLQDIT